MAVDFKLYIPPKSRVLVTFRIRADEIPKDTEGDPVLLVDETPRSNSQLGKVVFGGTKNPAHKCAQFSLDRLLELGFLINNICCTVDRKNENFYWVQTWFNQHGDEQFLGTQIEDWDEAGEFVRHKLQNAFDLVTVYDNKGAFSINMLDYAKVSKFIILPCVSTKMIQAEKSPALPVVPKATLKVAEVKTEHARSSMQEAFLRSGLGK